MTEARSPSTRSPSSRETQLAQNECPVSPSRAILESIQLAARGVNRYPERFPLRLLRRISETFEVDIQKLAIGPGSAAVFHRIVRRFARYSGQVVYPWRSFEAYPQLITLAGAYGIPVPLQKNDVDLRGLRQRVDSSTRIVVVCNPNNPTGSVIPQSDIADFAASLPPTVLVVVDEAYCEFHTTRVGVNNDLLAGTSRNLVILRTFSKAFGLAGTRVGFSIAAPEVTDQLRMESIPFEIPDTSTAAVISALERLDEVEHRIHGIVRERERLSAELRRLGLPAIPSHASYLWLDIGAASGTFAAVAAEHNVALRCFDGEGVRVSVGTPRDNDTFLACAERYVSIHGGL